MLLKNAKVFDKIHEMEDSLKKKYNISIPNISHWNSERDYQDIMMSKLKIDNIFLPFDYKYPYSLKHLSKNVLKKFGVPEDRSCILTQSSTLSIVNISNFLQKYKFKKVCILQPSYFAVSECLRTFGVYFDSVNLILNNNRFIIPYEIILNGGYDVVWITSPVYSSGVYFSSEETNKIQYLINNGVFVICDESLAMSGKELHRTIIPNKNFISFCSPHKSISVNLVKFSIIFFDKNYEDFIENWTDVISGGLSASNISAIHHFCSTNYDECVHIQNEYVRKNKESIYRLLTEYKNLHTFNMYECIGYYMIVFVPRVDFKYAKSLTFIKRVIEDTHISLLPGYLYGYDKDFGFCFRINLLLDHKTINNALPLIVFFDQF